MPHVFRNCNELRRWLYGNGYAAVAESIYRYCRRLGGAPGAIVVFERDADDCWGVVERLAAIPGRLRRRCSGDWCILVNDLDEDIVVLACGPGDPPHCITVSISA